jgi:hypothetical protein
MQENSVDGEKTPQLIFDLLSLHEVWPLRFKDKAMPDQTNHRGCEFVDTIANVEQAHVEQRRVWVASRWLLWVAGLRDGILGCKKKEERWIWADNSIHGICSTHFPRFVLHIPAIATRF